MKKTFWRKEKMLVSFSGSLKLRIVLKRVNSLPSIKILDWSNFKAYADNKINVAQTMKLAFDGVDYNLWKN